MLGQNGMQSVVWSSLARLLVASIFCAPGTAVRQAPQEGQAMSESRATKLLEAVFFGPDDARSAARDELLRTRTADYENVFAALAKGLFVADREHRDLAGTEHTISLELKDAEVSQGVAIIQVPSKVRNRNTMCPAAVGAHADPELTQADHFLRPATARAPSPSTSMPT
jgi:hypothetical protein